MTIKIKHKRGTASNITSANPTLAAGELAFETDTRRFKVGDGTTAWSSLSYVTPYVTATDRILGRSSAGAGSAEELTCTAAGRALLSGADAAAQRTTLSVQPTASPAFTGAATFDNTGNVVPLTVTNTGTANSFVVNDASGDTTPFVITSAGDVTIGTGRTVTGGSGGAFLASNGLNNDLVTTGRAAAITGTWGTLRVHQVKDYAGLRIIGDTSQTASYLDVENSSGTTLVSINSSGQLLVTAGSASACGVAFSGDVNTGLAQIGGADTASLVTAGVERVRVGSNGRVQFFANSEKFGVQLNNGSTGNGPFLGSDGADILTISTSGGAERVRVDASGNVGIGASSPSSLTPRLHISSAYSAATASTPYNGVFIASSDAQAANTGGVLSLGGLYDASSGPTRFAAIAGLKENGTSGEFGGYLAFYTRANGSTPAERVRVNASGTVTVGTTNTDPSFNNVSGVAIGTNYISMSRDNVCFGINRSGTDGDIAVIRQDGVTEGSISVSGNTVSYNAFCGSHWAQLIDGSRPAILRGTVLETIDEMCEWPGEPKNDRLPRVKVSDTPGSRRVYGVFMGWDEDDTATGDMYCTALGAYMVRVSGVVQSGDLLESAGDGTARTQPDDIVRSSTIGKVSSTHRVAEYDDGSYLVPCVLLCG